MPPPSTLYPSYCITTTQALGDIPPLDLPHWWPDSGYNTNDRAVVVACCLPHLDSVRTGARKRQLQDDGATAIHAAAQAVKFLISVFVGSEQSDLLWAEIQHVARKEWETVSGCCLVGKCGSLFAAVLRFVLHSHLCWLPLPSFFPNLARRLSYLQLRYYCKMVGRFSSQCPAEQCFAPLGDGAAFVGQLRKWEVELQRMLDSAFPECL